MASEESTVKLTEATTQLSLNDNTGTTTTQPLSGVECTLSDHTHQLSHDQDSEGDNEDDPLARSTEDEVGQLLRATVEELESALQVYTTVISASTVHLNFFLSSFPFPLPSFISLLLKGSRKMLADRDEELARLHSELDRYKQQVAREIANKTKLAQTLDASHSHASELEELIQKWQLDLRNAKLQGERATACLQQEQSKVAELERKLHEMSEEKDKEIEQLKSQLVETRQKIIQRKSSTAADSNPGPDAIDQVQLNFLKQAVYHLLTDFHAEDQLRAILSILDYGPQERKAVYAKVQEKKSKSHSRHTGVYM